jgi:hypothetical protein
MVHTQLGNGGIIGHGDKKFRVGAVQYDSLQLTCGVWPLGSQEPRIWQQHTLPVSAQAIDGDDEQLIRGQL